MDKYFSRLIAEAKNKYDEIFPINKNDFDYSSFIIVDFTLFFWFNTADKSTLDIYCKIKE